MKKTKVSLEDLKIKEKFYFDTYKSKKSNVDKIKHLEEMAEVIRQIEQLTNG